MIQNALALPLWRLNIAGLGTAAWRSLVQRRPKPAKVAQKDGPEFSVVVCSIDNAKLDAVSANYRRLLDGHSHEIVAIRDARSLAEGYNRGIARACGKYLILSHDDIEILTPDFARRVAAHLESFDVIGIAGTTRVVGGAWFLAGHPYDYQLVVSPTGRAGRFVIIVRGSGPLVVPSVQAIDGVFMAMRAEVAREVQFDPVTFDHFHLYDIDFSFRAYLRGYRLAVCRDIFLFHDSLGHFDAVWEEYRQRFESKFSASLPTPSAGIDTPVLRFQIDANMLRDEGHRRWLCDPANMTSLIARLPNPDTQ
ncbi:MAG TPA: glycosyltransferase [Casimicrobiaceae bacterium]|nr:glycosyltransferase [Casimicrobiaceae bacterium]